jgi:hypothetical protein
MSVRGSFFGNPLFRNCPVASRFMALNGVYVTPNGGLGVKHGGAMYSDSDVPADAATGVVDASAAYEGGGEDLVSG